MILEAFKHVVVAVVIMVAAQGCAGGSSTSGSLGGDASTSDCATIQKEIHDAAVKRGINPNGVCSSTDPQVMTDFKQACADAKANGC
jgi:hypothetical protein